MPEVSPEPRAELTVQGAPGGALFVLIAGSVKVVRDDSELSRIDEPGAIFGEVPLLLGTPVAASVIATSPSRFYVIEDGATFQRDNPDFTPEVADEATTHQWAQQARLQLATACEALATQQEWSESATQDLAALMMGREPLTA